MQAIATLHLMGLVNYVGMVSLSSSIRTMLGISIKVQQIHYIKKTLNKVKITLDK